jgi:hypothetical protein
MAAEHDLETFKFYAGGGEHTPVFEELPVRVLGLDTYELLCSPGLALNMAKGDIVKIVLPNRPADVLKRGGNFCIQIYSESVADEELSDLKESVASELNGSVDGVYKGNVALSVPASNGIQKVRSFFDAYTKATGKQWYYGNIYKNFEDVSDETLLDWWM